MELHERHVEILAPELAESLQSVGKGQVLAIETILTDAKLDTIAELSKPGTLIYSQFVDSIFPMIHERLTRKGFRVGAFNGEDKSGLELFKKRELDVLIGSSALGTGVDGLQYVCNRLIVSCLPWTSAGYEQLLGRVYRQGGAFHDVEVFVPQVVLRKDRLPHRLIVWSAEKSAKFYGPSLRCHSPPKLQKKAQSVSVISVP